MLCIHQVLEKLEQPFGNVGGDGVDVRIPVQVVMHVGGAQVVVVQVDGAKVVVIHVDGAQVAVVQVDGAQVVVQVEEVVDEGCVCISVVEHNGLRVSGRMVQVVHE